MDYPIMLCKSYMVMLCAEGRGKADEDYDRWHIDTEEKPGNA